MLARVHLGRVLNSKRGNVPESVKVLKSLEAAEIAEVIVEPAKKLVSKILLLGLQSDPYLNR
jgi:hypothetical protein